jgi:hypothetical protein
METLEKKTLIETLMESNMKRLKTYFPFRKVWGAISPDGREQVTGANATMKQANSYARKGWTVYVLS